VRPEDHMHFQVKVTHIAARDFHSSISVLLCRRSLSQKFKVHAILLTVHACELKAVFAVPGCFLLYLLPITKFFQILSAGPLRALLPSIIAWMQVCCPQHVEHVETLIQGVYVKARTDTSSEALAWKLCRHGRGFGIYTCRWQLLCLYCDFFV